MTEGAKAILGQTEAQITGRDAQQKSEFYLNLLRQHVVLYY